MSTLPTGFAYLIAAFAPLFSKRVFSSIPVLVFRAIRVTGKRTVTAVLRVLGHSLLVRRAQPLSRTRQRHGCVVPLRHAGHPPAQGVDSRSAEAIRTSGLVMHGWACHAGFHSRAFRAALAAGSHLRRSPCPPRLETQRPWSDQAIARTTPCLLGL